MNSWLVMQKDIRPVKDMGDSLSEGLSELDEGIAGIDLDSVFGRACEGCSLTLCSVDCVCISGKTTYFIEFKPIGHAAVEIAEHMPCKAMESLHFFDRFVKSNRTERRVMWVVSQNIRDDLASNLSVRAGHMPVFESLKRYGKRDATGQTLFYDEVRVLGLDEFMKKARSRLGGSTADRLIQSVDRFVP